MCRESPDPATRPRLPDSESEALVLRHSCPVQLLGSLALFEPLALLSLLALTPGTHQWWPRFATASGNSSGESIYSHLPSTLTRFGLVPGSPS